MASLRSFRGPRSTQKKGEKLTASMRGKPRASLRSLLQSALVAGTKPLSERFAEGEGKKVKQVVVVEWSERGTGVLKEKGGRGKGILCTPRGTEVPWDAGCFIWKKGEG